MLIILTCCLVLASVLILCVKRSRESFFLCGLSLSLLLEITGVMIFIAKKGGISPEVVQFLYFSRSIQQKVQFFLITFNQMGYLVALGRILFPYFLMRLALHYTMIPALRKNPRISMAVTVFPAVMLIVYLPWVYRLITGHFMRFQKIIADVNMIVLTIYLVTAVALLVYEYFSITMRFCRRQFSLIVICLISMTGLYCLYFQQDPGQVYHFYSYTYAWNRGIGYLQVNPSFGSYVTLVVISVICCVLGFVSIFRYTQENIMENREEVVMERKFDTARVGASMFVHSMKNQLLSSKVIFKRIDQLYDSPDMDKEKLREYVDALEELNGAILGRMEELYSFVKTNSIYIVPVTLKEIAQCTLERFHEKYPDVTVHVDVNEDTVVLADKIHFSEALYNLLINAQDAVVAAGREANGQVSLLSHNERLYTVLEVRDNGNGMTKTQRKKIFEPFYSSKNSNFNWGMGLYYVREIVKSHLGSIRVESKEGEGSSFFILLPKYQ